MNYSVFICLGISVLILGLFILFKKKLNIDTPLLGFISLGVLTLYIGLLRPSFISLGDLKFEINKIKSNIREFAIIENGRIESSYLSNNKIKLIDYSKDPNHNGAFIEFTLAFDKKPRFIEVRSIIGEHYMMEHYKVKNGLHVYKFKTSMGFTSDDNHILSEDKPIIIELYK